MLGKIKPKISKSSLIAVDHIKKTFLFFIATIAPCLFVFTQDYCIKERFDVHLPASAYTVDSNLFYIKTDFTGIPQNFTVFQPNITPSPFIMFIHGGGFSTGDKRDEYALCQLLAQKGFVTASINYRLAETNNLHPDPAVSYLAQQDAHLAWNYFRKNAGKYGIDTNYMFVAGQSAGAMVALNMAFVNQKNWDEKFPGLEKTWGPLATISPPAGVIDMWGVIGDTNYISRQEANSVPILMFHGTTDMICPFTHSGPPLLPEHVYGSGSIVERYENLDGNYQLFTKTGAGHAVGFDDTFLAGQIHCFINGVLCKKYFIQTLENEDNQIICNCCWDDSAIPRLEDIPKYPSFQPHWLITWGGLGCICLALGLGFPYLVRKYGPAKSMGYIKALVICLAALSFIITMYFYHELDWLRYNYQHHTKRFITNLVFDVLSFVALFWIAKQHLQLRKKNILYWLACIVYIVVLGKHLHTGNFIRGINIPNNIFTLLQILPLVVVIADQIKKKRWILRLFLILGSILFMVVSIYGILFTGTLPCPVGDALEHTKALDIYYQQQTILSLLNTMGWVWVLSGIAAMVERKMVKRETER